MPQVAIIMGSSSDSAVAEKAEQMLKELGISYETVVLSAHRTPNKLRKFIAASEQKGVRAYVALAGLAAHLPGVVASLTVTPVIGIPVDAGPLHGQDALYSIVQMPPGIPVATVGIGNAKNAALLAAQIIATGDSAVRQKLVDIRKQFGDDPG